MKHYFKYYKEQILLFIILLSAFASLLFFMLWGIGEWQKEWLLRNFIISTVITILLSTIYSKIK